MRQNMHKILNEKSDEVDITHQSHNSLHSQLPQTKLYEFYYCEGWQDIMVNSLLSLTPRGFGRTAFDVRI